MRSILAILFAVFFFLPEAKGQGEIYGTVIDSNGVSLNGILIKAFIGSNLKASSLSEEDGTYSLKPLTPGTYNIEFSLKGFCNTRITGVPVSLYGQLRFNCKMRSANSTDTIIIFKMRTVIGEWTEKNLLDKIRCYPPPSSSPADLLGPIIRKPHYKTEVPQFLSIDTLKNESPTANWLNTNKLRNKTYTEKEFQYTNLEYFISTLPQLQR